MIIVSHDYCISWLLYSLLCGELQLGSILELLPTTRADDWAAVINPERHYGEAIEPTVCGVAFISLNWRPSVYNPRTTSLVESGSTMHLYSWYCRCKAYAVGDIARVPKKWTRSRTSRDATPPSTRELTNIYIFKHNKISLYSFNEYLLH